MPIKRVPHGTIPRSFSTNKYDIQRLYEEQAKDIDRAKLQKEWKKPQWREDAGKFSPYMLQPEVPKEEQENVYKKGRNPISRTSAGSEMPDFTGPRPQGFWGRDSQWQQLSPYQKAAAMSLLEADSKQGRINFMDARNAMGAMINRADKEGEDLGDHVSRKIYQPTIEPAQYSRLAAIVQMPQFKALTDLAEQRANGQVGDWVGGATHFLAKPQTMLDLEAKEPDKYKSWRKWTGYDDATGRYKNEVMADDSHVFLAPEGKHSAGGFTAPIYGAVAEMSGPPPAPDPFPDPSSGAPPAPELPKMADLFGLPGDKKKSVAAPVNAMADLQSAPFKVTPFEGLPEQDDRAFALLPAQRLRPPAPGQPTLPVPRRPPGYPRPA
jgi:hypothetical protein